KCSFGVRRAYNNDLIIFRVPIVHAATRLILASKKSRPILTLSSALFRTISKAISRNSSSNTITWSLSHLTGLETCIANKSLYTIYGSCQHKPPNQYQIIYFQQHRYYISHLFQPKKFHPAILLISFFVLVDHLECLYNRQVSRYWLEQLYLIPFQNTLQFFYRQHYV